MLEVRVEAPKRLRDDPEALRRWESGAALVMTRAVAAQVRHRVQDLGQPADPYRGPDDSFKGVLVSPRYPGVSGQPTRSGAIAFATHAAMYSALGARSGSFAPSGGMWDGLSARSKSVTRGQASFRGRSEGQDPAFFAYASGKVKARGRKVTNALKAASVLSSTGINLLAITDDEFRAIESAVVAEIAQRGVAALGFAAQVKLRGISSDELYRRLREAFVSAR